MLDAQTVQIHATLYATAVRAEELDRVVDRLEALPSVQQAFWHGETKG